MFKQNRLIWKESAPSGRWYERGVLNPAGNLASGLTSIAGKCFNRFGRGLGTMSTAPEATTSTLDEALKVGMMGARNAIANVLAPFGVMRSDKAFLDKTKEAIKEIWHSSIKGTAKSAVMTIGDPMLTLAGVDIKKNAKGNIRPSYRKNRGVLGLLDRVALGGLRTATFFTGIDTPDPQQELIDADKEAADRLQRRHDWTKPNYLGVTRPDKLQ